MRSANKLVRILWPILVLRARDAVNGTAGEVGFCDACFTGNYPVPLVDRRMQDKLAGTGASFATDAGGPLL